LVQTGNYSKDSELINAIRSGDQAAFCFLVENYQDKIIRTCKGFVHSDADAEDIAQEVFIEVFKSADRFRGESQLSTWIYRIAINKSINYLKSSSRHKIISIFTYTDSGKQKSANDPVAAPEYCPDDDLKRDELTGAVKKAIDLLPDKQRTAFILSKYEDLTYQEIASIMHITLPSVESLLFRAKKNLQKRLYLFYKKNMM
jgi:RNA polymerase sigma-70 factor, ECF subfamily